MSEYWHEIDDDSIHNISRFDDSASISYLRYGHFEIRNEYLGQDEIDQK